MAYVLHSFEETKIYDDGIMHYTCNPPSLEVLLEKGIKPMGASYELDPRELLYIPHDLYRSKGLSVRESDIKIVSEQLLRMLDYEAKYGRN